MTENNGDNKNVILLLQHRLAEAAAALFVAVDCPVCVCVLCSYIIPA